MDNLQRKGEPQLYRGVQMRSHAEARVASYLDYRNIEWIYEPERIGPLDYLPDFYLPQEQTYLEVKPPGVSLAELAVFYHSAAHGQERHFALVYVDSSWQLILWDWFFQQENRWVWLSEFPLERFGDFMRVNAPNKILPSWVDQIEHAGRYSRLVYHHPHPEWEKKK